MADKLHGAVRAGVSDLSLPIVMKRTVDGLPETGIVAATITGAHYYRQGGSDESPISVSNLAALSDAHSDGGWLEVDGTNMPGVYRFDLPDGAVAGGSDWVAIQVRTANSQADVILPIETEHHASLAATLATVKAKTDNLPSAIRKNTALANFPFKLRLAADHVSPATGKTASGFVSKDGGLSFTALSGSPTIQEVGNGWYKVTGSIAASDLNADVVIVRFTATGCDDSDLVIFPKAT